MKREVLDVWFYRMKTLPNREPLLASSLCSMGCLWLVLISALILAIKGAEFDLRQLIIPSICAIGLATILFARWKRMASQIKEQESSVKNYNPESIERILGKLSATAASFQWTTTIILVLISANKGMIFKYIDVHHYSLAVQGFCIVALLFSFVLNRLFTYSKKRLDEVKELTPEERTFLKYEYLGKFLFPQVFWAGAFALFHWVVG